MLTPGIHLVVGALLALGLYGLAWLAAAGWHHGDRTNDADSRVALVATRDGEQLVEVHIANHLQDSLLVTASARAAGPLASPDRSTRRHGVTNFASSSLGIVDGNGQARYRLPLPCPRRHVRLLVEVHIWQPGGRLRRHRHLLTSNPISATQKPPQ